MLFLKKQNYTKHETIDYACHLQIIVNEPENKTFKSSKNYVSFLSIRMKAQKTEFIISIWSIPESQEFKMHPYIIKAVTGIVHLTKSQ